MKGIALLLVAAGLWAPSLRAQGDLPLQRKPRQAPSAAPAGAAPGILNLNCMAALAAVDHADLAGVFTFISEKDSSAAFADFLARNKAAMKKYLGKIEGDLTAAGGVTTWDHEVIMRAVELYNSPLAEALDKIPESAKTRLAELGAAPTLSLEELTARKKAAAVTR